MPTRPSRTKIRDGIALMVLFGTWLVMPPMLTVVNQPASLFGIPSIVVYVFVVWAGLILITRILARRAGQALDREEAERPRIDREHG